jgi:hypothetical protein
VLNNGRNDLKHSDGIKDLNSNLIHDTMNQLKKIERYE